MRSLLNKCLSAQVCFSDNRGSGLIETALLAPIFVFSLIAAIDFGQAYLTSTQVAFAAHAAALYGTQYPTDNTGIVAAANNGSGSMPGMTVRVSTGCECFDGSGASAFCTTAPSCSMNVVDYVDVTTTAIYSSILPYPGIPSSITLTGRSRLRTAHNSGSL